jgi:hypothetical protein
MQGTRAVPAPQIAMNASFLDPPKLRVCKHNHTCRGPHHKSTPTKACVVSFNLQNASIRMSYAFATVLNTMTHQYQCQQEHTNQGLRVIAMASRPIEGPLEDALRLSQDELEAGCSFMGLVLMVNRWGEAQVVWGWGWVCGSGRRCGCTCVLNYINSVKASTSALTCCN